MAPPNKKSNKHQSKESLSLPARVTRSQNAQEQKEKKKEDLIKLVHDLQAASEDPKTAEKIAIAKDQIKKIDEDTKMGENNQTTELPNDNTATPIKQEDVQSHATSASPKSSVAESPSDTPSSSAHYDNASTPGTRASSEEGLFVAGEDDEDAFTLEDAHREIDGGSADEGGEPEGWLNSGFGKKILLSHGPRNAAKYRIKSQSEVTTTITSDNSKNLTLNRLGERKINGIKIYQKGSVAAIQGIAWEYPNNEKNPIRLLSPANRPVNRKGQPYFRLALVKVRLSVPTVEGRKQEFVTSWETRSSFRTLFGNREVTLKESVELDGNVLISNTEPIGRADAAIIKAAINCEKRHREYLERTRPATDNSPTPDNDPEMQRLRDMSPTPDLSTTSKTD